MERLRLYVNAIGKINFVYVEWSLLNFYSEFFILYSEEKETQKNVNGQDQ